jgi:tetratricopeptide (TPR) repeat protein
MQQKMPDEAFEIYQNVLKSDPQTPYIYMSLSEYYQAQNQPEKAIESIVTALKNPQLAVDEKLEILGQHVQSIIKDSTRFDETDSLFKLLVEHYPLEEQVQGYYSIYLQFRNLIPQAIEALESMININPKNQQSWLQMIQLYLLEQKYKEVISVTNRAITNLPEIPQFYFFKAVALFQTENHLQALNTINIGLANIAENDVALKSDFYAQIGDIQFKLKNDSAAFEAYEQALKYNSSNLYVMNNYAYYLSEMNKDLRKAELMSAKTVEKDPSNSTYLDTYAWIFYQQSNYTLAKFYIEKAIDNLKDEQEPSVIYEHYGDILWKKGDAEKALEMWKKAAITAGDNEFLELKIKNKGMKD